MLNKIAKILEHFLEACARDILGMEMAAKANWKNFYSGFKLFQYRKVLLELNLKKICKNLKK